MFTHYGINLHIYGTKKHCRKTEMSVFVVGDHPRQVKAEVPTKSSNEVPVGDFICMIEEAIKVLSREAMKYSYIEKGFVRLHDVEIGEGRRIVAMLPFFTRQVYSNSGEWS